MRRAYIFADTGDSIHSIATRLMPGDADATRRLMSWNLHLVLRRSSVGDHGALLGSDIIYVEPPLP